MGVDWSALALHASENAGVDVSKAVEESSKGLPEELKPWNVIEKRKGHWV